MLDVYMNPYGIGLMSLSPMEIMGVDRPDGLKTPPIIQPFTAKPGSFIQQPLGGSSHPMTCKWLITMVIVSPLTIGLFPFRLNGL